jgi:hypothetical protein
LLTISWPLRAEGPAFHTPEAMRGKISLFTVGGLLADVKQKRDFVPFTVFR